MKLKSRKARVAPGKHIYHGQKYIEKAISYFYRRLKYEKKGEYPKMEEKLHQEFVEHRRSWIKVKGWWLRTRAKQILESTNPSSSQRAGLLASRSVIKLALGGPQTQLRPLLPIKKLLYRNFTL